MDLSHRERLWRAGSLIARLPKLRDSIVRCEHSMKRVLSHPLIALALGLWLRLFFLLKYPASSGDIPLYDEIATNWLKHGVYGMNLNDVLTPVDVRMPGYPAFLALMYALTGHTGEAAQFPIMLAQAIVDLLGCIAIGAVTVWLVKIASGAPDSRPAFRAGIWLAALCPITANYSAVLLTESLAICASAISIYFLIRVAESSSEIFFPASRLKASWDKTPEYWAALFGVSVGAMTYFRPESPIFLVSVWLVLLLFFAKHGQLTRGCKLALLSGIMIAVSLSPWAIRNAVSLHEFQFLAPKDTTLPSEIPPRGFMAWEKTWLYRLSDCYAVTWKLNEENINLDDIPARAFDSESEKGRVAALLAGHNQDQSLAPEEDATFGVIARERTARHPLRTYLWVPFQRVLTIWFTPRIELLPYSGNVFPLKQNWEDDRQDQAVTVSFFFLNVFYLGLACAGAWKLWNGNIRTRPALLAIAVYLVLRTLFLTTVEAPEPRYVLVCFPAILALGAAAFIRRPKSVPTPR